MKYGLHGKLQAIDGKGDELANILLKASELMSKVEGCHAYIISTDPNIKDAVWVTEIWDNVEAHDSSLGYPGVKELISQAMPILAGQPQKGQVLEVLGGTGLK